jgi:hypothetical protein
MANVIKIKNSGTANSAPTSLEVGELAINYADGLLFYKDSRNTIVSFDISGTFTLSAINEDLMQVQDDVMDLRVAFAMQIG